MKSFNSKFAVSVALFVASTNAFCHDGHGLAGTHWHATDAAGFVALGVAIVAAIYLSRGGK